MYVLHTSYICLFVRGKTASKYQLSGPLLYRSGGSKQPIFSFKAAIYVQRYVHTCKIRGDEPAISFNSSLYLYALIVPQIQSKYPGGIKGYFFILDGGLNFVYLASLLPFTIN